MNTVLSEGGHGIHQLVTRVEYIYDKRPGITNFETLINRVNCQEERKEKRSERRESGIQDSTLVNQRVSYIQADVKVKYGISRRIILETGDPSR